MKNFRCQSCGQTILFENTKCESCGRLLGFLPEPQEMTAVEPAGDGWKPLLAPDEPRRFCANWEMHGCNWLTPHGDMDKYCLACRHNRTIPDLSAPDRHALWQRLEQAKRRLFYSLIRLRLPIDNATDCSHEPLLFDFLAGAGAGAVSTGHANGVITLSLEEADDAVREKNRNALAEPYRTLLGHFRHEIGHYYWDLLVRDEGRIASFRERFGDETADYGEALQRYYSAGAPASWQDSFISAYATCHPWEDFAETFAHYLHIVDTLETARAMGVSLRRTDGSKTKVDFDPYLETDADPLVETWLDVAFAVNNLNRSMGQPDLYPFVLSARVAQKLAYVVEIVQRSRASASGAETDLAQEPEVREGRGQIDSSPA
jgi:hypothetical protein